MLPQLCRTLPRRPTSGSPHPNAERTGMAVVWGQVRAEKKGAGTHSKQHADLNNWPQILSTARGLYQEPRPPTLRNSPSADPHSQMTRAPNNLLLASPFQLVLQHIPQTKYMSPDRWHTQMFYVFVINLCLNFTKTYSYILIFN